jgi:integrase
MSRTKTPPPYPRKAHASGLARVKINNRHVYLGKFGTPESYAEYERQLALWRTTQANGCQLATPVAACRTVADVLARWDQHAQATYSERGRELDQFRLSLRPVVRLFGSLPVQDFDSRCLVTLQQALASGSWMTDQERADYQARGYALGLCRNVINRRITRIKTVWKWADSMRLVPMGSYQNLRSVRAVPRSAREVRHTRKVQPAAWEDVRAVVRQLGEPVRSMLLLQWWSGMRSGEVRIIRSSDIDRDGPTWLYRPEQSKSDWREGAEEAPRVVPLGPKCQAVLSHHLRDTADMIDTYLFPANGYGRPYSAFSYAQAVRRAARRAGVSLRPYQLRHAAKMRITRALGADAARAVLGQKSIQTTAH